MKSKKKIPRSTAKLSRLDTFLEAEGRREEFEAIAAKEVLAWQIAEAIVHQVAAGVRRASTAGADPKIERAGAESRCRLRIPTHCDNDLVYSA